MDKDMISEALDNEVKAEATTDTATETKKEATAEPAKEKEVAESKEEKIDIDAIVAKALEKKEAAILKSVFTQQGVPANEIEAKIAEYKAKSEIKKEDALEVAKKENEALLATIAKTKEIIIDREISGAIVAAGVDPVKAELFAKLIDKSKISIKDDFTVNKDAIDKEIASVLEKLPEFKSVKEVEGGLKFGTQKQILDNTNNTKTYSLRDAISSKY